MHINIKGLIIYMKLYIFFLPMCKSVIKIKTALFAFSLLVMDVCYAHCW